MHVAQPARKTALVAGVALAWSITAWAGPKEEAQAVADKFIAAFVAGDLEATASLYSPDAMFWGTVSPELGTSADVLRKYFADNYAARANVALDAINAQWQKETGPWVRSARCGYRAGSIRTPRLHAQPLKSASVTESSALVLSDDTVVVAGRWQTERPNALSLLRFTMVMHKKGGQWQIVHLHSSPRPKQ